MSETLTEPSAEPLTATRSARVSILLVTRNGIDTLPSTLVALRRQRTDDAFEIVAVDSGSTDGTAEFLAPRVDRLLRIPPGEFNHGTTRNAGIAACRGSLVVLLVQDALPASDAWLRELVAPFADPRVAGTYARQEPRPEASAVTRHYLAGWSATSPAPRRQELASPGAWETLTPQARLDLCTFDDVCSAIRRAVWETIPFPRVAIAEDVHWARAALLAGHCIAYAPAACVVHSHERSARAWASTVPLHRRLSRGRRGERLRALALAFAYPCGQYLGGRDGARDAERA